MNTSLVRIAAGLALVASALPADAQDWSAVRKIKAGQTVVVTIAGSELTRQQVSADDSSVTLLRRADVPVETYRRTDVDEIRVRQKGRGFWGHLGGLGGWFVGGLAGGYGLGLACQAVSGTDSCDTGAFMRGMVVGGIAGGTYGLHASRRETEKVIYRAP